MLLTCIGIAFALWLMIKLLRGAFHCAGKVTGGLSKLFRKK